MLPKTIKAIAAAGNDRIDADIMGRVERHGFEDKNSPRQIPGNRGNGET